MLLRVKKGIEGESNLLWSRRMFWPDMLRRCVRLVFLLYVPYDTTLVLLRFHTALFHSAVCCQLILVFVAQLCIVCLAIVVFHYMSSSLVVICSLCGSHVAIAVNRFFVISSGWIGLSKMLDLLDLLLPFPWLSYKPTVSSPLVLGQIPSRYQVLYIRTRSYRNASDSKRQGDHLAGKPGNVRECNVWQWEMSKNWAKVWEMLREFCQGNCLLISSCWRWTIA